MSERIERRGVRRSASVSLGRGAALASGVRRSASVSLGRGAALAAGVRRSASVSLGWGLGLAAALAAGGCTIIIEPPDPPPARAFLVPFTCVPLTVDPRTGASDLVTDDPPPTAHILFTARVERTAANLAEAWSVFMEETVVGLSAMGFHVANATLLPLDERPVRPVLAAWGCGLDDPERLTPQEVIRYYATELDPPDEPIGCATDPLLAAGRSLGELTTDYPPGLEGSSGRSIFGEVPDLLLVVHLDPLARRQGFEAPACQSAAALAGSDGGRAPWLDYGGQGIDARRVVHWFVATDEGVDDTTLMERCRTLDGFPVSLFDSLEASPRSLYAPLARRISDGGIRAAELSMCRLLVESARREFLLGELTAVGSLYGRSLDPAALLALLAGDPVAGAGDPGAGDPGAGDRGGSGDDG